MADFPDAASPGALNNALLTGLGGLAARAASRAPPGGRAAKSAGSSFWGRILRQNGESAAPDEITELESRLNGLTDDEAVAALFDDIRSAGTALQERPFPNEVVAYKKSVRNFMRYVLNKSYDVEISAGRQLRGGKKKHVNIIVVDQKLEQLASEILLGQITQLKLLERTNEIRGLLVDMLS